MRIGIISCRLDSIVGARLRLAHIGTICVPVDIHQKTFALLVSFWLRTKLLRFEEFDLSTMSPSKALRARTFYESI